MPQRAARRDGVLSPISESNSAGIARKVEITPTSSSQGISHKPTNERMASDSPATAKKPAEDFLAESSSVGEWGIVSRELVTASFKQSIGGQWSPEELALSPHQPASSSRFAAELQAVGRELLAHLVQARDAEVLAFEQVVARAADQFADRRQTEPDHALARPD